LLDPIIQIKRENSKIKPWHIYIDKSLSLKYYKQPSHINYVKSLSFFIEKLKRKNIALEIYSFGSSIDTLSNILNLETDANSTNIGVVFEKIKSRHEKNISGAMIFTDGQINHGPLLSKFSNYNSIPIFFIGIGDTIPMLDVYIQSIDLPPTSVKGKEINIEATIASVGDINDRVNVTLFNNKNRLLGSKVLKIYGNESQEKVRFQIKPNYIGKNSYIIKCSALSDEVNIENNKQKAVMHVMKDEYNIAIITGAPNYNTRLIKEHLTDIGNNRIDHFIYNADQFENSMKKFLEKKYEVIVFDNNPIKNNYKKWDSLLRVFTKKLISHNSSFLIIPGPDIELNSIKNYLKTIDIYFDNNKFENHKNYKWVFNDNWKNNFFISNISNKNNFSGVLPPQTPAFNLKKINKKNIFADYNIPGLINPLLVLGEKKSIRYCIWNSLDISSFKYKLINSDRVFIFGNTLDKVFNWLMKKSGNQEYIFRSNKNNYQQGEKVLLSGKSINDNDDFLGKGVVELYQDNNLIGSKPLFYDISKKEYKSEFWAPNPGKIDYVVKLNKDLESFQISNGNFEVEESHIELNRIFLNKKMLDTISENSNGKFKYWSEFDSLIDDIEIKIKKEKFIQRHVLRYNTLILFLIISLLILEWIIRRRVGLL